MALPCALFSSSAVDFRPQEFVKHILRVSELPEPLMVSDSIESYKWSFETKYYSATIHLCTTDNRTIGDKDFADSVQAFIHFFDPNVPSSFELAKAWLPYLNHIEPEVLMLVCTTSRHTDAVERKIALEWCIQNGFELVELQPEHIEDEDDDFPETTGMARIIQALHAHTWPNLDMKESPPVQSPYLRQMMKEQHILNQQQNKAADSHGPSQHSTEPHSQSNLSQNSTASENKSPESSTNSDSFKDSGETSADSGDTQTNVDPSSEGAHKLETNAHQSSGTGPSNPEDVLKGLDDVDWMTFLGNDAGANEGAPLSERDLGVDEFEKLFMKLKVMKDRAENLPPDQRKRYAEKVAISFWKAIGGDEDEIDGLDADSD